MSEQATICNVGDQEWTVTRTYGMYRIPAPQRGNRVATLKIEDRSAVVDMGDNRHVELPIHARRIAEDLAVDLSDHGVFVASGDEPSEVEIEAALAMLTRFREQLVSDADMEWSRHHNHTLLTDVQRRAARSMGIEREWLFAPDRLTDCPACGERIRLGVAVCKSCGAVLDREKARRFGLIERDLAPKRDRETSRSRA